MNKREFSRQVTAGYKRIPLVRQHPADLDTPVSTYLKIANKPYTYLLESVVGGERRGRYSFIGLSSSRIYKLRGEQLTILEGDKESVITPKDPLTYIGNLVTGKTVPPLPGLPRFHGGLVGYFSHECVGWTEARLRHLLKKEDSLQCPHVLLLETEKMVVFDNLLGKILLISYADAEGENTRERALEGLDAMEEMLTAPFAARSAHDFSLSLETTSGALPELTDSEYSKHKQDEAAYCRAVETIKNYIRAGDVMQVVPSQRMRLRYAHKPFDFYRLLRTVNPAPYMFYFDMDDFQLAGASPEILSRLEDGEVTLRPIAGTRPRGKTEAEDLALEKEMLTDPKERAEHVMLIDLARNDLGRIAETGTVEVTDNFSVERYSRVMHIVSNVRGKLRKGLNAMDVLRASLPAGTLSGAPKIRAIEIIDELEEEQRGVYGGALGYLGWNGNMDLCICIRTIVIKDGFIYVQAGGGVVADSQPDTEWEETLNKRRAIFQVMNMLNATNRNEA